MLSSELFGQFKSHIAGRCGLYFRDHDLKNLDVGVSQRMKACRFDSAHAYYIYLTTSEERETEFRELLNLLTINHTYFFRNEPQFAAFKDKVIPDLMERKWQKAFGSKDGQKPSLRIWSAGCSTGEEPYTIAMILREMIPEPEDWNLEIIATDASSEALAKAKRGIYGENSMRLVEEPYRSKYFEPLKSPRASVEWKISDSIKNMVKFGYLNLVGDPYPAPLDIIFCRNVTIYFEMKTTLAIMDEFFNSLNDPGFLFLGYSESLQFLTDKFRMQSWQDGIYYRKSTGKAAEAAAIAPIELSREDELVVPEELSPLPALEITHPGESRILSAEDFETARKQIARLIYLKEYQKALDLIKNIDVEDDKKADIHYLAADIYANMNRMEEAKSKLKEVLRSDSFFAPAYYLLGCIWLDGNQTAKAKENLQKALYLDKDFVMARFYMAQLLRSEGHVAEAIREYRNTLNVLSKGVTDTRSQMLLESSGFNGMTLKSICSDNLERLKFEA